jgi:hypothetical protein
MYNLYKYSIDTSLDVYYNSDTCYYSKDIDALVDKYNKYLLIDGLIILLGLIIIKGTKIKNIGGSNEK